MSKVSHNILANYIGSAWSVLMTIIFLPVYIKFMGVESYGLVGFFASLEAFLVLLDLGLATTVNREIAGMSGNDGAPCQERDLVRTLEVIYWAVAALIAVTFGIVGPEISVRWVNIDKLSKETVRDATMILALVLAFRWPDALYSGVLRGLQRIVILNWITALVATIRGLGAVLALWLVSPTIETFLAWQVVASIAQTSTSAICAWRLLPRSPVKARFSKEIIARIWKFSAGMTAIGATALILTQMDKLILSRILSLRDFGYYTFAATASVSLMMFATPIAGAVFPKMSALVAIHDEEGVKGLYHRSSQLVTVMTMPVAIVLCLFSYEILLLWTGNAVLAEQAAPLVTILALGTAFNAMMQIPYHLQVAWGWTSLPLGINIASIAVLVPCMTILVIKFGAVGAAVCWILLNTGYLVLGISMMHRRILIREKWYWYRNDFGLPTIAALVPVGLARILMPDHFSKFSVLGILFLSGALSYAAALCAASGLRGYFVCVLKGLIANHRGKKRKSSERNSTRVRIEEILTGTETRLE